MTYKNELIIDGKIQKDVKLFEEISNFNISAITGTFLLPDNTVRNRYTFIRVIYEGDLDEHTINVLQPGNLVRLYGKIDSEQYLAKSGKTVYNKVLKVYKVNLLEYDPEIGDMKEVI